jgi:hypothetical protein
VSRRSLTRARRIAILASARLAAKRGDHMLARLLFASVDISYVPFGENAVEDFS